MSIKLINIKKISQDKFEVVTSNDGKIRLDIITRKNDIFVESMNEFMNYFSAEEPDFGNIWGSSFEFRQEVSHEIKELMKEKEIKPA